MANKETPFFVLASINLEPVGLLKNNCNNNLLLLVYFTLFIILLLYSPISDAIEWQFSPRLTVSETYTDNVRLGGGIGGGGFGATGSKQGDFITQINPGFNYSSEGRRFNSSINYTMNNLIFAQNSNLNRIRHQLSSNSTAELMKDLFFLDTSARITQQNLSTLGPQAVDNTNVTNNRRDIRTFNISPYLRHSFATFASTELRYTRGIVESSVSNGLRNSQRDSYQFNLNSGRQFRKILWGYNYSKNIINFSSFNREIKSERSLANIRYNLNQRFALTATGGIEKNSRVNRGNSTTSWTVGFSWNPTPRTNLDFSGGRRFFGNTFRGNFSHRIRLATFSANYIEEVTTFNQQAGQAGGFGGFGGGIGNLGSLNALNSANNGLFLQKRFRTSIALNGNRNTLTFAVFNLLRKPVTSFADDPLLTGIGNTGSTKQTGSNANWRYTLGPRTNVSIGASFVQIKRSNTNITNDNIIYTANLTRRFNSDLSGFVRLRSIQRKSGQFGDITGNSVTISLRKNF